MKILMERILKNRISQFFIRLISASFFVPYVVYVRRLKLNILDAESTIDYISKHRISLGRFGDGEFNIIFRNKSIGFQQSSDGLRQNLISIKETPNFKIAIPYALKSTKEYKFLIKTFWWRYVTLNSTYLKVLKNSGTIFLDTNFSRVITELKDKEKVIVLVKRIRNIWKNKNVIIVEGKYTRFGVGNDLLDDTKSVSRVIAPAKDAYTKVNSIYEQTLEIAKRVDDPLILISLGPTATYLAYRFSDYYQSIDIGHFDLQYQYLQKGYYHKVRIDNRYDNEMINGNRVKSIKDKKYKSEIKAIIK